MESEKVPTPKKYHDYLLNPSDSSFCIQLTTEDEVGKYIETLKNHKTNGSVSLPIVIRTRNSLETNKAPLF